MQPHTYEQKRLISIKSFSGMTVMVTMSFDQISIITCL